MMIDENAGTEQRLDEETEIKVKVPKRYQLALHELKVVTGKQISTTVTEAIEMYFRELDVPVDTGGEDEGGIGHGEA